MRHERLAAIYSSSLNRAVETARPTAEHHALEIQAIDDLKEMHFGVLQGRTIDDTDPQARGIWQERSQAKNTYRIPDGETFTDFESRVLACLERLLDDLDGTALIVAHRNTNEVILAKLLALDYAADLDINVKNKYLYEIELTDPPRVTTIRIGGERHGQRYAGFKTD
jgi:broad specificity phosphatase PhoE